MPKKVQSGKFVLTQEECYQGLAEFYDIIAMKMQYNPAKVTYDCRKIRVTKPVQDQIHAFYEKERHASAESIGAVWLGMGPKANLPGDDYRVEVEKGFIMEVKP